MKVSTKGRYALRLMLDLAKEPPGSTVPLGEIAKRQEISVKYLEQIVPALCRAGYLESVRGAQGGYRLSADPERITAGDVLRVTEGDLSPVACLSQIKESCPRVDSCETIGFWRGLAKVIDDYVDGVSLADILKEEQKEKTDQYYI